MISPFDLFKQEPDGRVQWLGAIAGVETAKAKARQLMVGSPGVYFVYSQAAGNKLYIKAEGDEAKAKSS